MVGAGAPLSNDSESPPQSTARPPDCEDLRLRMDRACAGLSGAQAAAMDARDTLTGARQVLYRAESRFAELRNAGDPGTVRDAKEAAQRGYRDTCKGNADPTVTREALLLWMREVDHVNRESLAARARLGEARGAVAEAQSHVDVAAPRADAARIRAESAAHTCRAARQALAACEESEYFAAPRFIDAAGPGMRPVLVVDRLFANDRSLHGRWPRGWRT